MTTHLWSAWKPLDEPTIDSEQGRYGIYQVGILDDQGSPIPVGRLGGVDQEGILYIGRSGFPDAVSKRGINQRLKEFLRGSHSGGETYELVEQYSQSFSSTPFSAHKLRYRAAFIHSEPRIRTAEVNALADYFKDYSELPPCNSSIPGKWQGFVHRLKNPH